MKLILTLLFIIFTSSLRLSTYYYGPQSPQNDVNSNSSLVIVAFATINSDGTISLPDPVPCQFITLWKSLGMKVLFSIGGQGANWTSIFASNATMNASIASIANLLQNSPFQGVDLDLQQYTISPYIIGPWIKQLKSSINGAYVVVTPQCVGVYQGQPILSPSMWNPGDYWNFWVPILNVAMSSIDLVQVQAYNNWYDNLQAGTLAFLQDVTLQWLNLPSPSCAGCSPLTGFSGVPVSKLAIGIPASSAAGNGYPTPQTIQSFITWTQTSNNTRIPGMMIWDSHWDSLNNYLASNAIVEQQQPSPINPLTPTITTVCSGTQVRPLQLKDEIVKKKKSQFNHPPIKVQ